MKTGLVRPVISIQLGARELSRQLTLWRAAEPSGSTGRFRAPSDWRHRLRVSEPRRFGASGARAPSEQDALLVLDERDHGGRDAWIQCELAARTALAAVSDDRLRGRGVAAVESRAWSRTRRPTARDQRDRSAESRTG